MASCCYMCWWYDVVKSKKYYIKHEKVYFIRYPNTEKWGFFIVSSYCVARKFCGLVTFFGLREQIFAVRDD